MARPNPSPFVRRRFLVHGPTELVAPSADPVLMLAIAALVRAGGDEAEVRAILDAVPPALHVVLVDRMAGRQHLAPALAVVLQLIPRDRLGPMSGVKLSALYKAARGLHPV